MGNICSNPYHLAMNDIKLGNYTSNVKFEAINSSLGLVISVNYLP